MTPAMPCQRTDKQHPSIVKANAEPKISNGKEFKTVYGGTVESHESTRQRAESLQSKAHEDRIAGKGFTSMSHATSNESGCKDCRGQGMEKLETIPAWDLGKVKRNKEVILEAQRDRKKSPLCFIDGHLSSQKMRTWNPFFSSTKA